MKNPGRGGGGSEDEEKRPSVKTGTGEVWRSMEDVRERQWPSGRPARREGRKEEGLNQGMGNILEGRGLYLCSGTQEGEVESKRRSRGGTYRLRDKQRRQGKDGDRREPNRNKNELPVCCVPEKIPVWDMGEGSMGKAGHPPWNVQKQRMLG